jgi:hypothetical protein
MAEDGMRRWISALDSSFLLMVCVNVAENSSVATTTSIVHFTA